MNRTRSHKRFYKYEIEILFNLRWSYIGCEHLLLNVFLASCHRQASRTFFPIYLEELEVSVVCDCESEKSLIKYLEKYTFGFNVASFLANNVTKNLVNRSKTFMRRKQHLMFRSQGLSTIHVSPIRSSIDIIRKPLPMSFRLIHSRTESRSSLQPRIDTQIKI